MVYTLSFEDKRGKMHKLECFEADTGYVAWAHTMDHIRAFWEGQGRKIYYIRGWNEDNATVFDVGSHTEFFYLSPKI